MANLPKLNCSRSARPPLPIWQSPIGDDGPLPSVLRRAKTAERSRLEKASKQGSRDPQTEPFQSYAGPAAHTLSGRRRQLMSRLQDNKIDSLQRRLDLMPRRESD